MTAERGPLYDAFVVRLWRDATTGLVLRAEVEHAGSGSLARAAGVSADWVLRQIHACLQDHLAQDDEAAGRPTLGPPDLSVQPSGP